MAIYTKLLHLDTTTSGANVASDASNFPVCVHINSSSFTSDELTHFFSNNTSGDRCRVYDYDQSTPLDYEVSYSDGSSEAILWVRKPTVKGNYSAASGNLNDICLEYGTDPGSIQTNTSGVWLSYSAAWHLGGNSWATSAPQALDSSSGGIHGTDTATSAVPGVVGQGRAFAQSTSGRISLGQGSSLDVASPGNFTLSVWFKTTDSYGPIFSLRNHLTGNDIIDLAIGWDGVTTASGVALGVIRNHSLGGLKSINTKVVVNDGQWHYAAMVHNRTDKTFTVIIDRATSGVAQNTDGAYISSWRYLGTEWSWVSGDSGSLSTMRWFDGSIDEPRFLSNAYRTIPWCNLEYESQRKTNYTGDVWVTWDSEASTSSETAVDIRITGFSEGTETYAEVSARITGYVASNTATDVRIAGYSATNTSFGIRVTGYSLTSETSLGLRITGTGGPEESSTSVGIYITAEFEVTDTSPSKGPVSSIKSSDKFLLTQPSYSGSSWSDHFEIYQSVSGRVAESRVYALKYYSRLYSGYLTARDYVTGGEFHYNPSKPCYGEDQYYVTFLTPREEVLANVCCYIRFYDSENSLLEEYTAEDLSISDEEWNSECLAFETPDGTEWLEVRFVVDTNTTDSPVSLLLDELSLHFLYRRN